MNCKSVIQYAAIPATLGYATYTVVTCPCPQLLECKNHLFHFVAALGVSLLLVFVARACTKISK